jgi:hypothetical protein
MIVGLPGGNGGQGGHGLGLGDGAGSAGGATAVRKARSTGRPQAAARAWTMVERAPKPGGGAPARRAKRRSLTLSAPRAQTGGAPAGAAARTFVACVTVGARMARDGRVLSRILATSGACDPRGRRLTTATSALVARERGRHVVEAGRAGEREAQRGARPVGHGVADLGEGDLELGRRADADPVGVGRDRGCERDDERGEQDSAHVEGIPPPTRRCTTVVRACRAD